MVIWPDRIVPGSLGGPTPGNPAWAWIVGLYWLSAVFLIVVITGVVRRLDGHAKPHVIVLIGEALIGLCAGCFAAVLHARPSTGRSDERGLSQRSRVHALLASTLLGVAVSMFLTVVLVSDLLRRFDGHPRPRTGSLIGGAIILGVLIAFVVVSWRRWHALRRSMPTSA
jgi:MFS family permease